MNVEKNVIIDCFVVILFKISWYVYWLFFVYYIFLIIDFWISFLFKKKGWYFLINVSDLFFFDKFLKYCDDFESDKKWYFLSDVNSLNSLNLRNLVLLVNFRLYMYIK